LRILFDFRIKGLIDKNQTCFGLVRIELPVLPLGCVKEVLTELALIALENVPDCRTTTGHRYTAAELPTVRENVRMRT
jgi:hypothetical protein